MKGFRDFILPGNVVDLAVGIVIGAAFTAVVSAFATVKGGDQSLRRRARPRRSV